MKKCFVILIAGFAALSLVLFLAPTREQPETVVPAAPEPRALPVASQAPPLPAEKVASSAPAKAPSPAKTVLKRIAENDGSVFKLSAEEVQAFLARNRTNAESLLAAFNVTSDKEYLREAVRRFPDEAFVLVSALASSAMPDQQRELIDRLKKISPDNPLANYLAASEHVKNKQPGLALEEFTDAASKNGFHDFTVERIQGLEEIYLGAGYSAGEAKALAMAGVQLPSVSPLRELGREMAALQRQYAAAGDAASAEMVARMGLNLAADISGGTANSLLSQIVGGVVAREFLQGLDANGTYDFVGGPINDRVAELERQDRAIREAARFFEQWIQNATDAQLVSYFDRLKLYGEAAAITWARSQRTPN